MKFRGKRKDTGERVMGDLLWHCKASLVDVELPAIASKDGVYSVYPDSIEWKGWFKPKSPFGESTEN